MTGRGTLLRRVGATLVAGALGVSGMVAVAAPVGAAVSTEQPNTAVVSKGPRPAAAYNELTVTMIDNQFLPRTTTVNPGTTIHWSNEGRNEHNVKPVKASAGFGDTLIGVGEEYQSKFETPRSEEHTSELQSH